MAGAPGSRSTSPTCAWATPDVRRRFSVGLLPLPDEPTCNGGREDADYADADKHQTQCDKPTFA